jgi:hypothetical protein
LNFDGRLHEPFAGVRQANANRRSLRRFLGTVRRRFDEDGAALIILTGQLFVSRDSLLAMGTVPMINENRPMTFVKGNFGR